MSCVLADSVFVTANYLEAALWGAIGVGFLLYAIRKPGGVSSVIASIAFLFFGLSDVIETRTGAWWRPWWLLAMKGLCLAVFLALLIRYMAGARAGRGRVARGATPDRARPASSSRPSRSPDRA